MFGTLQAQKSRDSLPVKPGNSESPAGTTQSPALPPEWEDGNMQLTSDVGWTPATAVKLTEQH